MPTRTFTAADLLPGRTYRVVAAFEDYDGRIHAVGESWRFLRKNFIPYDDGLSLFVEREGKSSANPAPVAGDGPRENHRWLL